MKRLELKVFITMIACIGVIAFFGFRHPASKVYNQYVEQVRKGQGGYYEAKKLAFVWLFSFKDIEKAKYDYHVDKVKSGQIGWIFDWSLALQISEKHEFDRRPLNQAFEKHYRKMVISVRNSGPDPFSKYTLRIAKDHGIDLTDLKDALKEAQERQKQKIRKRRQKAYLQSKLHFLWETF
jgi:hypothetical protein